MSKELMITSFIPTKEKISFKGFVKRTVTTAFGDVTFERRKYVNKKTGIHYYIDEKLDLSGIDGFLRR